MLIHRDPFSMIGSVKKAFAASIYLSRSSLLNVTGKYSEDLNLKKSTTYRFLTTCNSLMGVRPQSEPGKCSLGSKVVWFTCRFFESIDFRGISRLLVNAMVKIVREITAKIAGVYIVSPNPIQDF